MLSVLKGPHRGVYDTTVGWALKNGNRQISRLERPFCHTWLVYQESPRNIYCSAVILATISIL